MQVFLHICAIFLIITFYEGFFSALHLFAYIKKMLYLCSEKIIHSHKI